MRWQARTLDAQDDDALPALSRLAGAVRVVSPPGFPGVHFHEVLARSALNRVPDASQVPFRWTVNPYRGCQHACVYCFARGTHTYLDLDPGQDFDTEIVVKVNVVDVLSRELGRASWQREPVALGTNTDPYQRAEGRYRLMPGIVTALARSGTPLSVLTKGTLLRRDLPLYVAAARDVPVGLGVSVAVHDEALQQRLEPGTPTARARLDLVRAVVDAGLPCGVLLAPVLPWLTDSREHLDAALAAIAAAGARRVGVIALHLRPGTREWFLAWLAREHPGLVDRYRALYGSGSYASADYRSWLDRRVRGLLTRHGLGPDANALVRPSDATPAQAWSWQVGGSAPVPSGRPDPAAQLRLL